jgi:hypothetical protein
VGFWLFGNFTAWDESCKSFRTWDGAGRAPQLVNGFGKWVIESKWQMANSNCQQLANSKWQLACSQDENNVAWDFLPEG